MSSFLRNYLYLPFSKYCIKGSNFYSARANQAFGRPFLFFGIPTVLFLVLLSCAHPSRTQMVHQPEVLMHRLCHTKNPLPRSQIFPFLKLPLEIRIIIYNYMIANAKQKSTRRRLPSLFHTNLQITREIYRYCTLAATYDIRFPNISRKRLSQLPGYWAVPYVLFKAPQAIALVVLNRQVKKILHEAQRFAAHKDRKGLLTYIRTRCRCCDGLGEWQISRGCRSCRKIVKREGWQEMLEKYGSLVKHY